MTAGEKYLAAAYVVVLGVVVAYVAIISLKLARLDRELEELTRIAEERERADAREEVSVG